MGSWDAARIVSGEGGQGWKRGVSGSEKCKNQIPRKR